MSKTGGGSISNRAGGGGGGRANSRMSGGGGATHTTTPRSVVGGGGGGGRDSHFKVLETDAKYGMLMWQSKLQEKLLKEQKEKKQKELSSTARRKSDEDYQTRAQNRTGPLRGGGGSGGNRYTFRTTESTTKDNDNHISSDPTRVNFQSDGESPNEFRIEISGEGAVARGGGSDEKQRHFNPPPTTTTTPTHFITNTDVGTQFRDLSEKFVSGVVKDDESAASDYAQGKYFSDTQKTGGGATSTSTTAYYSEAMRYNNNNDNLNNSDGGFYAAQKKQEWVNNGGSDSYDRQAGEESNYHQNQYQKNVIVSDLDPINKTNTSTTTNTMLPKIGHKLSTGRRSSGNHHQMPNLANSVSYDSLTKPQLNSLPNHHHYIQNPPAAGMITSIPYNFSTNLAFFGLSGFGEGTGAGAPRRSPSGRLITNLQGHPDIRYHQKDTRGFDQTLRYMMDKERVAQYKEDLDKQVLENARQRVRNGVGFIPTIKIMSSHESNQNLADNATSYDGWSKNGRKSSSRGTELAPLIRKYKSLPKLNTLSSTDVTKQFSSPRRSDYNCLSPEPEEIAKGLSMQLAEKQRIHQITQENEKLAAEKHFNTWDSFWGRPGCGAPMYHYRNSRIGASTPSLASSRTDLFKALHMTHQNKK